MARSFVPFVFEVGHPAARPGADPFLMLHREVNRVLDDALRSPGPGGQASSAAMAQPRMNVGETATELRIELELPGVSEADVHVEMAGDVLTIHGEKRAEHQDMQHHVVERSFGTFARSLRLPLPIDPARVQASFHNGVLTVTLPKPSMQDRVRRIPVQAAGNSPAGHGEHAAMASAVAGHPTSDTTHEGGSPRVDETENGR